MLSINQSLMNEWIFISTWKWQRIVQCIDTIVVSMTIISNTRSDSMWLNKSIICTVNILLIMLTNRGRRENLNEIIGKIKILFICWYISLSNKKSFKSCCLQVMYKIIYVNFKQNYVLLNFVMLIINRSLIFFYILWFQSLFS